MPTFRWLTNNSLINCERAEDYGQIIKFYNGTINHLDGAISNFDFLILPKNEVEKRSEEVGERRPPRRRRSSK